LQRIQDYHKVMRTLKFQTLCSFKGSDDIFHADVSPTSPETFDSQATAFLEQKSVDKQDLNGDRILTRHVRSSLQRKSTNPSLQCVLWLGDLNFRITKDTGVNWKLQLQQPNVHDIESTLQNDELGLVRRKELAFAEFREAPITFAPTHKFELGSNDYVPNRIPSFTDRVLFWTKHSNWMECTAYNCIQKPSQSDHRPVYATFRLEVINKRAPRRFNSDRTSNSTAGKPNNLTTKGLEKVNS
uniref:IPPc domain-containing protein n=1 Tax=Heligmosomoides polygyrus TaxID=6339 RepID=A0A183GTS5_HELPZ